MYNIEIENKIYDSISRIIDDYIDNKTLNTKDARNIITRTDYDKFFNSKNSIFNAKTEFNKESSINQLLKDIKYIGHEHFKDQQEYKQKVIKLMNDIIDDRVALEKDMNEGKILKFDNFIKKEI